MPQGTVRRRKASHRITQEAARLLVILVRQLGVSKSAVVEDAIIERARVEGLEAGSIAPTRPRSYQTVVPTDLPQFTGPGTFGTSFTLTPAATRLLAALAEKLGLSQVGVIELLIRDAARKAQLD